MTQNEKILARIKEFKFKIDKLDTQLKALHEKVALLEQFVEVEELPDIDTSRVIPESISESINELRESDSTTTTEIIDDRLEARYNYSNSKLDV